MIDGDKSVENRIVPLYDGSVGPNYAVTRKGPFIPSESECESDIDLKSYKYVFICC